MQACANGGGGMQKSWNVLVIFAVVIAMFGPAAARDQAQPESGAMFRGGPSRTGVQPGPGIDGLPNVLWRIATGSAVQSSPVVSNGVIFVGSDDGTIYALDLETGKEIWHLATGAAVKSSPAVADGVVYFGNDDGVFRALDAGTGTEQWHRETGAAIESSAAVVDGVVYFGSDDGFLHALRSADGEVLWTYLARGIQSSPAVAGGVVYFGSDDGNVYALDAVTGQRRWQFATGDWVKSTPVVAGGMVYAGSNDGFLYAIDAAIGELVWKVETGVLEGGAALSGDKVFAAGWNGDVLALDATTGREIWRADFGEIAHTPVVVAGGMVYAGGEEGISAFESESGELAWRVSPGRPVHSSPAVIDGKVLYGGADGFLYAISGPVTDEEEPVAQISFRGGVDRTGVSDGTGPGGLPHVRWQVDTGSDAEVSPVVADGVVYTGADDGFVQAYDPTNGNEIWRADAGLVGSGSVTIANGVVYAPGMGITALDSGSGEVIWQAAISSGTRSSPVVAGQRVYATAQDGDLYAFDLDTGLELWRCAIDAGLSSPAVWHELVIAGTGSGPVAVDAATGTEQWRIDTFESVNATPLIAGDRVFIVTDDGMVAAIDVQTGEVQWRAEIPGGGSGASPALTGGILIVAGYSALVAYDEDTGDELWTQDLRQDLGTGSSPVIAGDTIYVGETAYERQLGAFDLATGDIRWDIDLGVQDAVSSPAVGNEVVFINAGTSLFAIDGQKATPEPTIPPDISHAGSSGETGSLNTTEGAQRGGPARTGEQPGPGPSSVPVVQWSVDSGPVSGEPVIAGNVVYTASGGGGMGLVSALDLATGTPIWTAETQDLPPGASVATNQHSVFAGTVSGNLLALDIATGERQWEFQAAGQLSSPVVADGLVFIVDDSGLVSAVDASTGVLAWQFATGQGATTPAVANDMVIAGGSADGTLFALNVTTGAMVWHIADASGTGATPVISGSNVYILGPDTTLLALDLASGSEIWRADVEASGGLGPAYPAVAEGVVYVVDSVGLHAFDAVTGEERWTYASSSPQSSPSVAGGVVYLSGAGFDGTVTAVDAATGTALWSVSTGEVSPLSSPAVSGGLVIAGSYQHVIALGDD